MSNKKIDTEQGHWALAKMGKRVLRPGGKKLTYKLVDELHITNNDSVVEFAPGMGFTAACLIDKKPKSYRGIELNEEAAARLTKKINTSTCKIVNTSASQTGLADCSTDKVIGEAMLTMQADHRKLEIMKEAYRILKPGGYYGIHELGLTPNDISSDAKKDIQQNLAHSIRVNARPLTKQEWCSLLEESGFKIKAVSESPMHLLHVKRVLEDEGVFRTLKIGINILLHPKEKKDILHMRDVFKKYEDNMTAFAIVAEKAVN